MGSENGDRDRGLRDRAQACLLGAALGDAIGRPVEFLDEDRPLHKDHTRMKELVRSCAILEAVEAEIGSLG